MLFGKKVQRSGEPEWDGQAFAFDDPRVPPGVREAVAELASPGDTLYFADSDEGGEWWLLDAEGGLIESFWLEKP